MFGSRLHCWLWSTNCRVNKWSIDNKFSIIPYKHIFLITVIQRKLTVTTFEVCAIKKQKNSKYVLLIHLLVCNACMITVARCCFEVFLLYLKAGILKFLTKIIKINKTWILLKVRFFYLNIQRFPTNPKFKIYNGYLAHQIWESHCNNKHFVSFYLISHPQKYMYKLLTMFFCCLMQKNADKYSLAFIFNSN